VASASSHSISAVPSSSASNAAHAGAMLAFGAAPNARAPPLSASAPAPDHGSAPATSDAAAGNSAGPAATPGFMFGAATSAAFAGRCGVGVILLTSCLCRRCQLPTGIMSGELFFMHTLQQRFHTGVLLPGGGESGFLASLPPSIHGVAIADAQCSLTVRFCVC
jgi:hypothetical protein